MIRDIRWSQVVISFLLGCIVTAAVFHSRQRFWNPDPKGRYERMLERFSRELNLSDEQKPRVAAVFEEKRKKIEAIRTEVGPRFEEVRRNASEEIRRILTPEQQVKFEEMERKHAEMRSRWHEHGYGPSPR
jgi:Spy/CpxP family protein refolding chaperone